MAVSIRDSLSLKRREFRRIDRKKRVIFDKFRTWWLPGKRKSADTYFPRHVLGMETLEALMHPLVYCTPLCIATATLKQLSPTKNRAISSDSGRTTPCTPLRLTNVSSWRHLWQTTAGPNYSDH